MGRPNYIRNAARALIVEQGALLVVTMFDSRLLPHPFYVLPGGGQQPGETALEALRRECFEELGCPVEPIRLAYVREYRGAYHDFAKAHEGFHQVEVVFQARLLGAPRLLGGAGADARQKGVRWLPFAELADAPVYPQVLRQLAKPEGLGVLPRYLGDVN